MKGDITMVTQELIDTLLEGHFDEDLLGPVNIDLSILDAGIDEEIEAGDSIFESYIFDETIDSMLINEEEN